MINYCSCTFRTPFKKKRKSIETNFTENDPENECHMDTHLDVSNFSHNVDKEIDTFIKGQNKM